MPTVQAVEARAQQAEISHRMQQPDQAISSPDLLEYKSSVRATLRSHIAAHARL